MKRRFVTAATASLLSVVMLVGCTGGSGGAANTPASPAPDTSGGTNTTTPGTGEAPQETAQTTLTVVVPSLAVSMDPPVSNDSASAEFSRQVHDTLFRQDYETFEVLPNLGVDWSMPDPQTLHVQIREGVTFHNGDPLTAEDVAFSLKRAAGFPDSSPILGMIRDTEALDDQNVAIYLEIPFAPITAHLAHPTSSIVPKKYVEEVGDDAYAQEPIGAGAFKFQNLVIGDRIEMVRNENYWGDVPQIETLIFRAVPDPSTRLIEVSSGTADVATAIAPADVEQAEKDNNVVLMRRLTMGTDYIWMNARQPYLENPLVRQAIQTAFDSEAVVGNVFMGLGALHHNPVPPGAFGYAPQPPFETDLNKARELLAEAGYPDGFSTTIWWNAPNVQRQQVAEMMQFTLGQIGIDVAIQTFEWGAYLAESDAGNHDMMIIGWTTVTGDADYALFPLFHSTSYGGAGNRGFWSTPELDALLEAGRSETDLVARAAIYAEAQAIIRAEAPVVMLRQGETPVAVSPKLRNFTLSPTLHHAYAPVWFAE